MSNLPDTQRQTGRTTFMLFHALIESYRNKNVFVVFASEHEADTAKSLIAPAPLRFLSKFQLTKEEIEQRKIRGGPKDHIVFIDHHVYDLL
jgi:hypothetical protein